jgi:hypothetical protein
LLLNETTRRTGLGRGLSRALASWCPARVGHDPGKVLLDVAVAVALDGDCLADVAALRALGRGVRHGGIRPDGLAVFAALAMDVDDAVAAIRQVRADARVAACARRRPVADTPGVRSGGQVIVDIDAKLVTRTQTEKPPSVNVPTAI